MFVYFCFGETISESGVYSYFASITRFFLFYFSHRFSHIFSLHHNCKVLF